MIRKFSEMADGFSVSHSLTRDHREVGFSIRISSEKSMKRWLKLVPLLNPVQDIQVLGLETILGVSA